MGKYAFLLLFLKKNTIILKIGKVHGSLARAGKVKGQTPKVDKMEKTKKPKGRACQRIKYKNRFSGIKLKNKKF